MKKLLSINAIVMLIMMFFSASALASTKYDSIVKDPEWKSIIQRVDQHLTPNKILIDYFNVLVNKNDLKRLSMSGELDKNKSKFIAENSTEFLKYLHYLIVAHQMSQIKPGPTDAQFMYITGVIKDPRAQAATTGPEYEMEKALFREVPIYKLWEIWRENGYLKALVDEQIDIVYASVKKK